MTTKILVLSSFLFGLFNFINGDCLVPWQSQCFTFFNSSTQFADAELKCNKIGGYLASIHDGFANALVANEAANNFHESTETDFWIGATNLIKPPTWNWTDGTAIDFSDWKHGEPQNTSGTNCAALSLTDGTWSAQSCFQPKPYVCATALAPSYPSNANCSVGWSYFPPTHSCYGVNYGGFTANWTSAQNYCEDSKANLPAIHSYAEFHYVLSYVYVVWDNFWIGISSIDSGRTWKTSDGTDADFLKYSSWCPGSPLNYSGQHCVAVAEYKDVGCYVDINCSISFYRTLCKKPIAPNSYFIE